MIRRQLQREAGQALILTALVLPLFFAIALLVVDGSRVFVVKRSTQNAADASALAAARELKDDGSPCNGDDQVGPPSATCAYNVRTTVETYAANNGWSGPAIVACSVRPTNCYQTPYNGNQKVLVRLTAPDNTTFFGGVVAALFGGVSSSFHPSAHAAATKVTEMHCVFPPPAPPNPDQYLPDCTIPGQPIWHCFVNGVDMGPGDPAVDNCGDPGGGGTAPGLAFAMSTDCLTDAHASSGAFSNGVAKSGSLFINKDNNTFHGGMTTNGSFAISSSAQNQGANDIADYVAVGKKGQMSTTSGLACYTPRNAQIGTVAGPFAPKQWPITPPTLTTTSPANVDGVPCHKPDGSLGVETGSNFAFTSWSSAKDNMLYCSTKRITISTPVNSTLTNVGFVAAQFVLSSGSQHMTGYLMPNTSTNAAIRGRRLLIFATGCTGSNDVQITSGGSTIAGDVYSPCGQMHLSGNYTGTAGGEALNLFFESNWVYFDGAGATLNGIGPPADATDPTPGTWQQVGTTDPVQGTPTAGATNLGLDE
jgi:hypothetical protein